VKPVLILQHQVPENAAYLTTWLERNLGRYQESEKLKWDQYA
jgi:hypothetical protein